MVAVADVVFDLRLVEILENIELLRTLERVSAFAVRHSREPDRRPPPRLGRELHAGLEIPKGLLERPRLEAIVKPDRSVRIPGQAENEAPLAVQRAVFGRVPGLESGVVPLPIRGGVLPALHVDGRALEFIAPHQLPFLPRRRPLGVHAFDDGLACRRRRTQPHTTQDHCLSFHTRTPSLMDLSQPLLTRSVRANPQAEPHGQSLTRSMPAPSRRNSTSTDS